VGVWTRAGVAEADESLWEFFHHRDDVLRGAGGALLTPLLIFDQFEEIFTLAQSDDAGRSRAASFLEALAELVENRPSAALEAQLESDDGAIERFDFARNDYRVLITLREDYLAHLESLKTAMPSITQNRMRLAPMTGQQALSAVLRPGGALVTEEVAAAVVRFVAGGAELAHAQVEPSLLSLICRELNDKRVAAGRPVISLDLLAGSHASILADFYERALADQPAAVRQVVEDVLLTSSGYRENVAEERVLDALAGAGARPDARSVLALLVNRRLLRVEDRLDIRRVELTHDVLCGVVQQSRALRQERDKQAQAERELASQREREIATRQALKRARRTVAVCVVLTIVAIGGSMLAYVSTRRAHETQAVADRSRGEAEGLMSYLLDDFYAELLPVGRVDMLEGLTQRTMTYYEGLPPSARSAQTVGNWARALLLNGDTAFRSGNETLAGQRSREALALLQPMMDGGTATPVQRLSYADALYLQGNVLISRVDFDGARPLLDRAAAIARPIATGSGASIPARLVYARIQTRIGWINLRSYDMPAATANIRQAQSVLGSAQERAGSIPLTVAYSLANQWLHEALARGEVKDYKAADRIATATLADIAGVLRQRPNHQQAARIRDSVTFMRAYYALQQAAPERALAVLDNSIAMLQTTVQGDPGNQSALDSLSIYLGLDIRTHERLGETDEALALAEREWGLYQNRTPSAYQTGNLIGDAFSTGAILAETNERRKLDAVILKMQAWYKIRIQDASRSAAPVLELESAGRELMLRAQAGDPAVTVEAIDAVVNQALALVATSAGPEARRRATSTVVGLSITASRLAYAAGDYAGAAQASARAVKYDFANSESEYEVSDPVVDHALNLAKLARYDEAQTLLASRLGAMRALVAAGSKDQLLRIDLAGALFVSALCQPRAGLPELQQARTLLAQLPVPLQRYRRVQLWRQRIELEIKARSQTAASKTAVARHLEDHPAPSPT
jgi:hypothetical protein